MTTNRGWKEPREGNGARKLSLLLFSNAHLDPTLLLTRFRLCEDRRLALPIYMFQSLSAVVVCRDTLVSEVVRLFCLIISSKLDLNSDRPSTLHRRFSKGLAMSQVCCSIPRIRRRGFACFMFARNSLKHNLADLQFCYNA